MKEDTFFERMTAPTLYHVMMIVTHSKKTSAALKHEQRLHKLFESYAVGHEWFDFRGDETIIQHAIEEINNIE